MAKADYLPRGQRTMNWVFTRMVRWGIIKGGHLLSVPGRKSGVMRTTPVFVLHYEGQRWLVAGFKNSDWVKNVRAAGWGMLIRYRHSERVNFVEVPEEERAPIMREFLRRAPGGKAAFPTLSPDAPLEEFAALASERPVFRVVDTPNGR